MDVATWTVDKDHLLEVVAALDLIPARPGILASQFLRLDKGKSSIRCLLASEVSGLMWMKGTGSWPFQEAGSYYVDRRLLFPFVLVARYIKTKAAFEFMADKGRLIVKHGRRKAVFDAVPVVTGYGEPTKDASTVIEHNDTLIAAIRCARASATVDSSVPHLNCVYLSPRNGKIDILASNQIIIQHGTPRIKTAITRALPFPLYLVDLLGKSSIQKVLWTDKEVALQLPCGKIWQMVSSQASKSFPIKDILAHEEKGKTLPVVCQVDCKHLGIVVSRLAMYLGAVRRQEWILKLTGAVGSTDLTVEANVPQGQFRERVKCTEVLTQEVKMEWPLEFLLPVFEYMGTIDKSVLTVRYGELTKAGVSKEGKTIPARLSPYFLSTDYLNVIIARIVKGK